MMKTRDCGQKIQTPKENGGRTLGGDGVRAGGEQLGDASRLEAILGQTEGRAQTRTTGTDNHGIECVVDDRILQWEMREF